MPDFEKSEWTDLYLKGKLIGKDLKAFEKALQEDEDFANKVALLKEVRAAISEKGIIDFRKKLDQISAEVKNANRLKRTILPARRILTTAAVIIGLLIGAYFIYDFFLRKPLSIEQLYADNFSVPELTSPTSRGISNQKWEYVIKLYNSGKYGQALDSINTYTPSQLDVDIATYYQGLGYIYLMMDQPAAVIEALDLSFDALKSGEIAWYRALAYLKLKEIDQAILQLELVMQYGSTNRKKDARSLISKLKTIGK